MRRRTQDQAGARYTDHADLRLPPLGEPVWSAFWRLEQSRQSGPSPQAFTYLEIEAWTRLSAQKLSPWEVEALMAMDVARREVWAAERSELDGRPAGARHVVSAHGVAAEAMFDRFGEVRDA